MARFSRGKDSEDRLSNLLEKFGCKLLSDEVLDHRHKIDFVVLQFPEYPTLLEKPIGVQATAKLHDSNKKAVFFKILQNNKYAKRNVHLELDNTLDLENGGAFVTMVALMNFALNKQYETLDVTGIRIGGNLSFNFFDLQADAATTTVRTPFTQTARRHASQATGEAQLVTPLSPQLQQTRPSQVFYIRHLPQPRWLCVEAPSHHEQLCPSC